MTENQKKAAGWTFAGLIAAVVAIAGLFPHLKPWLDWLAPIFSREQVQAVLAGWVIAAFTLPLPWVLPRRLAPFWTRTASYGFAFVVAALVAFGLRYVEGEDVANRTALIYALGMAGFGSIVWNLLITEAYLHLRPAAKPGSLQP